MNNKIILTLLISTLAITAMGCQNSNSNIENNITTEKVIDESKRAEILGEFEVVKDNSLIEVAEFVDANIDSVTREDADTFVIFFIEKSKSDLLNVNGKLIDPKLKSIFGINFGPHAVDDGIEYGVSLIGDKKEIALSNLTDDTEISYIKEVFLRGQTINQYEGEYFLIFDYNYINHKYKDNVSKSLSDYLKIMDKETITPLTSGEYLAVPLDELQNRIVNYENFLVENEYTVYREDIRKLYSTGLWRVLSTFTYFNDFTDDFKLKGSRLDYYNTLKNLETSEVMTSAVTELYDFFYYDTNGLNDIGVDANVIIYNREKEIHSEAMLKIDADDNK